MSTFLSFLNIHQMAAEPASSFTGDIGIVHRWGYNEPGDDGEAVYRRVGWKPTAHQEWFERNGNYYEMIGRAGQITMAAYGLFGRTDHMAGVNATPYLDRAHAHGPAVGINRWQWGSGGEAKRYRFDTQPQDINFGPHHIGGAALYKNFQSGAGQIGLLNFRAWANYALLEDIGIVALPGSQRNGLGTGCWISIVPPLGTQANRITIRRCGLSALVPPGQAGVEHGIVADGTHGNTSPGAKIRGLNIVDTEIFGVETTGMALFIWGCSSVNVSGGGVTTGGTGKRAKTFIGSWHKEGPASQNIHFAPNGASEVELSNAHHVTLNSPVYEGLVSRDGSTSHINGCGHAKGGLSAGFVSDNSTWQGKVGP